MELPLPQSGESLANYLRRLFGFAVTDVQTSGNITAEIRGNTLSLSVPPVALNKPFVAKITGSSGAAFAWTEQQQQNATTWGDKPNGRSGTTSANPAYELNGNQSLATNTLVWMHQEVDTSNAVRFWFVLPGYTFPVKVQQTGGGNGTSITKATYTYTVRSLPWNGTSGGATLGTVVSQSKPRPNGSMVPQSGSTGYGLAFYDGTTLKLWDAGEVPATESCPGP